MPYRWTSLIRKQPKSPKLTQKRRDNIKTAFPKVKWHFGKEQLHRWGMGDLPTFKVSGTLLIKNQLIRIVYKTKSPSGCQASISAFYPKNAKVPFFLKRASYLKAKVLTKMIETTFRTI